MARTGVVTGGGGVVAAVLGAGTAENGLDVSSLVLTFLDVMRASLVG